MMSISSSRPSVRKPGRTRARAPPAAHRPFRLERSPRYPLLQSLPQVSAPRDPSAPPPILTIAKQTTDAVARHEAIRQITDPLLLQNAIKEGLQAASAGARANAADDIFVCPMDPPNMT